MKHAGNLQSEVSLFSIFIFHLSSRVVSFYFLVTKMLNTIFFLQSKYRAKGIEAFKDYTVVTNTPVYETAKQNAQNLSDVSTFCLAVVGFFLFIFSFSLSLNQLTQYC